MHRTRIVLCYFCSCYECLKTHILSGILVVLSGLSIGVENKVSGVAISVSFGGMRLCSLDKLGPDNLNQTRSSSDCK